MTAMASPDVRMRADTSKWDNNNNNQGGLSDGRWCDGATGSVLSQLTSAPPPDISLIRG